MNDLPTELVPRFRTNSPNEAIRILSDQMSLVQGENVIFSGEGEIEMAWLPKPGVRFTLRACLKKRF